MTAEHRIVEQLLEALRPYRRNARRHSKKQIRQIADSIRVHQHAANGKKKIADPVAWAVRVVG